ncbi:MAG: mechanosensitive ion channel family protein [Pseudomonadota bacterium]
MDVLVKLTNWAIAALPNLVAALVLLFVGWLLSRWAAGATTRFLRQRPGFDQTLNSVLRSIVGAIVFIIFLVAAIGQLGIETTSVIAALGAAGLAIGLALQGTLSNIAAGIMLLWLRPFQNGDHIDAEGIDGTVVEIGLFSTELQSYDGLFHFVPNGQIWNKRITNYTRHPIRMVEIKVGVAYDDDIELGKGVLLELVRRDPRVQEDPRPSVFVDALDDSAVTLNMRGWVATKDYWVTRRDLTERAKLGLERAGLSIPFPQRDLHHHGLGSLRSETRPS